MSDLFDDIIAATSQPPTVKKVEATETTKITVKDESGAEKEIKNETRTFATRLASRKVSYLGVRFATNINLGNFQSAKIEKSLLIPIGAEKDPELEAQIRASDTWACKLLEQLVEKESKPILESLKSQGQ